MGNRKETYQDGIPACALVHLAERLQDHCSSQAPLRLPREALRLILWLWIVCIRLQWSLFADCNSPIGPLDKRSIYIERMRRIMNPTTLLESSYIPSISTDNLSSFCPSIAYNKQAPLQMLLLFLSQHPTAPSKGPFKLPISHWPVSKEGPG